MIVKEAKLTRDTEFFGKMDPFCKIEVNGKAYKTKVHNGGGKTPKWGDEFEVPIHSLDDEVKI